MANLRDLLDVASLKAPSRSLKELLDESTERSREHIAAAAHEQQPAAPAPAGEHRG